MIGKQDDDVTLEFAGINCKSHPITIAGYDKSFELRRGHVTKISFKADKAGGFPIECGTHTPSMRAELVVLPRRGRHRRDGDDAWSFFAKAPRRYRWTSDGDA